MIVTGPLTPDAGVKLMVPSGFTLTVPSAGLTVAPVTLSGSPSGSLSLPSTLMLLTGVSYGVLALSGLATGASLTAVTSLMCTVATDETAPALSVTVKVTALTGPL